MNVLKNKIRRLMMQYGYSKKVIENVVDLLTK